MKQKKVIVAFVNFENSFVLNSRKIGRKIENLSRGICFNPLWDVLRNFKTILTTSFGFILRELIPQLFQLLLRFLILQLRDDQTLRGHENLIPPVQYAFRVCAFLGSISLF